MQIKLEISLQQAELLREQLGHTNTVVREVPSATPDLHQDLPLNLKEAEEILIIRAITQTHGNKSKACELLGISSKTLYNKLLDIEYRRTGRYRPYAPDTTNQH